MSRVFAVFVVVATGCGGGGSKGPTFQGQHPRNVRVGFDPDQIGGTLTIGSSTTTLGTGVEELPE